MLEEFENPALAPLAALVGIWRITVTNAEFVPPNASLVGEMTGSWLDGGAFLVLRSVIPSGPPTAVQVIGRNEDRDDYQVLYADERGVSRAYTMMFADGTWIMKREDPGFHQRFEARVSLDTITGAWFASRDDGGTWAHDFDITYSRTT
ncbi:hypothetical protein [Microbacterium sp. NPDC089696]|uniref:hypothetical protein n=1 Tax=Microbacterium sp. NPDC089696 TaxID=3364199 RepID=UPI0037F16110